MIRTAIAVALTAAALAVPTTASADSQFVAARKDCDLGFIYDTPTILAPGVRGDVWAQCDIPPESHMMKVSLETRQADGNWIVMDHPISDGTIPNPRATYDVYAYCVPGLWRIVANATGTLMGTPFNYVAYSNSRVITAKDCNLGRN